MNVSSFFEPSAFSTYFKPYDMSAFFDVSSGPDLNPAALMAAQKKNLEALVEANKSASETYKAMFEAQIRVLEASISDTHAQMQGIDAGDLSMDGAQKRADVAASVFEQVLGTMTKLADEAQKANTIAYKLVSDQIEASAQELKDVASRA